MPLCFHVGQKKGFQGIGHGQHNINVHELFMLFMFNLKKYIYFNLNNFVILLPETCLVTI